MREKERERENERKTELRLEREHTESPRKALCSFTPLGVCNRF